MTAIKNDGTGWVWGTNSYTGFNFPAPVQVITNAYHSAAGVSHAAFVKTDGTVWTVGNNSKGVYGDGTTTATCTNPTPCAVQMLGITNAKRVACDRNGNFTVILLADGSVMQTGTNNQMPVSLQSATPISVPGLTNVVDIKATQHAAFALTASGQVYSWGGGANLGVAGATSGTYLPQLITFPAGAAPIKAISMHISNAFAIDDNGNLYAWGFNSYGQIGSGTTIGVATAQQTPVLVETGVQDVMAGGYYAYMYKTNGTMWATGQGATSNIMSYLWMNLSNVTRYSFTQVNPTISPINLCAPFNYNGMPPCVAGTTAPAVTPTTASNSCPATTVDLTSLPISSTTPSGASLIWSTHKTPTSAADTLTTAQKTAVGTAGTYYALYYDATNACYSPADSVVLSITTCLSASNPAAQTATTGQAKTGNAATELAPTGGVSPYIYSDGTGDAACVAPSGATALPASSNLTVNSTTGAYTYTAPTTAGTYYYCIKVCDSSTPTADCVVKTYTLTVSVPPCNVNGITPTFIKN